MERVERGKGCKGGKIERGERAFFKAVTMRDLNLFLNLKLGLMSDLNLFLKMERGERVFFKVMLCLGM